MKRSKRHRIKQEVPETSTSRQASQKEHDLAYYIHDRVELMHQVFSVLKPKELKAMAPECVRHINISDLQELCMEELLGISSKRLCAILDGASPPSDTESSSESEQLETISLDSISSDEEILSQVSTKKSKKHKHRSKSKPKKRKPRDEDNEDRDQADRSRRAGLTVLELLELQARARAIRAQLQQEQVSAASTGQPSESVTGNSSDDEVEIKEEAAEVVEISSEDEKPDVQDLNARITDTGKSTSEAASNSKTVTKKVNDLIITVPKTNTSRKIKLKRNTSANSKTAEKTAENDRQSAKTTNNVIVVDDVINKDKRQGSEVSAADNTMTTQNIHSKTTKAKIDSVSAKDKNKNKDKKKKRKREKENDKYGSDHDEITLQLSDTEKMDLLEDLEGKQPEKCSGTEDSSSDSSDEDSDKQDEGDNQGNRKPNDAILKNIQDPSTDKDIEHLDNSKNIESNNDLVPMEDSISNDGQKKDEESLYNKRQADIENLSDPVDKETAEKATATSTEDVVEADLSVINKNEPEISKDQSEKTQPIDTQENAVEISGSQNLPIVISEEDTNPNVKVNIIDVGTKEDHKIDESEKQSTEVSEEINNESNKDEASTETNVSSKDLEHTTLDKPQSLNSDTTIVEDLSNKQVHDVIKGSKEKSDGELSDRDSSEVEASDFKPDVVCISDDEDKKGKKKKKKDKKSKKEKKSKKKKDFRESADQNFNSETAKTALNKINTSGKDVMLDVAEYNDSTSKCDSVAIENIESSQGKKVSTMPKVEKNVLEDVKPKNIDSLKADNVNIDLDLDDDVYEILELSDDSSCYEVEEISISKEPTAEEIEALSAKLDEIERDRVIESETNEDIGNVSWKDRYLKSSKVKKVLTTANIMNAMRKKNLELKVKLQESKQVVEVEEKVETITANVEDGSIQQYNTLETSNKYVDPVKEVAETTDNTTENEADKTVEDKNGTDIPKDKVTNEMKKEAKQLLKMYKMLLKYNDMSKQKDPNKKRKKKKKSKDKDKSVASQVVTSN